MPHRATRVLDDSAGSAPQMRILEQAFAGIREEFDVRSEFPADVLAAAERAGAEAKLPERDERDLPLLTIDPPGSMDLDQAMHLERDGDGYRVRYAIADVPAFVAPGESIDEESWRRGQTIYCPDLRVPLHPPALSEAAASLLPEQDCPAYLWDIRLDETGERVSQSVARAMVRSRERFTYTEVQEMVDAGTDHPVLSLLPEVGRLRIAREADRGGASLPMPEQEVHVDEAGHYTLRFRPPLPAEEWNAQISLLTGVAAAQLMLDGGVGILRTMPAPDQRDVDRFRRQARGLGVRWPAGWTYGEFLRQLDRTDPRHLALVHSATALFRGAGYTVIEGQPPESPAQAAIGAPYAHVTAPLRRLVDRYGLAVCAALSAGVDVPQWARDRLADLPAAMTESDRRARAVERACVDATEAVLLAPRVGEEFEAVVVDAAGKSGWQVQVAEPAVLAGADGEAGVGDLVQVRLTTADPQAHQVRFEIVRVLDHEPADD